MQKKRPARLWAYELDGETRAEVHNVGEMLAPHLDEVLEGFYGTVMDTPDWAGFFDKPGLREHAMAKQKEHWRRMFLDDFSQDYFTSAERIGRVHYRIGLSISHYVASYSRVGLKLQGMVLAKCRPRFGLFGGRDPSPLIDALSRVLMLDTEIAVTAFHEAQADDYAERREKLGASFQQDVGRFVEILGTSMRNLDDAAGGMNSEIAEARHGAGALQDSASEIAASAQSVAAAIEQLSASIASITNDVSEAATASSSAAETARASSTQVESLLAAAEEIGEVVNLISEIAKQTNLLAVNATVEASRAGDAGKGFAVVAYEVKALAERITEATGSITERIGRIQSETDQIATRITGIGESVGRVQAVSENIRTAVEEQRQAADHIAQHAETTAANTNEMAERLHEVTARVERSGDTSQSLKTSVTTVSGETLSLAERVRNFVASLKAA